MSQNPSPFKVSAVAIKGLIGAAQKKGLKVKSIAAAPDGTITISVAAPALQRPRAAEGSGAHVRRSWMHRARACRLDRSRKSA